MMKIKPCPKCGSDDIFFDTYVVRGVDAIGEIGLGNLQCKKCNFCSSTYGDYEKEDATYMWNMLSDHYQPCEKTQENDNDPYDLKWVNESEEECIKSLKKLKPVNENCLGKHILFRTYNTKNCWVFKRLASISMTKDGIKTYGNYQGNFYYFNNVKRCPHETYGDEDD